MGVSKNLEASIRKVDIDEAIVCGTNRTSDDLYVDFYLPSQIGDVTLTYQIHRRKGYFGPDFVDPIKEGETYKIPNTQEVLYRKWVYVNVNFKVSDDENTEQETIVIQVYVTNYEDYEVPDNY